jgi:hypothetical protein
MLEQVEQELTKILSWRDMPRTLICKTYRVTNVGTWLREQENAGKRPDVVYYNAITHTLYAPFSTVANVEVFGILE